MRRMIFSVMIVCMIVSTCGMQASTRSVRKNLSPKEAFDGKRLKHIDDLMERAVERQLIPSAICYVAYKGKPVYFKAFGEADREVGKKLRKDAIFRMASQTKLVTTVALLSLYEDGLFKLDDPIKNYLPEFSNPVVHVSGNIAENSLVTRPAVGDITIRQLLSHSSGLSYDVYDQNLQGIHYPEQMTLKEAVKRIAKLPLKHDPGKGFTYGFNLDVAGRLAEVISGMRLDSLIAKRVLKPLDMKDTYFYLPLKKIDRLVPIYQKPEPDAPVKLAADSVDRFYPLAQNQLYYGGGAGLSGTIEDYAHLCQMVLDGGVYHRNRVLSRMTVEQMCTDQLFGAKDGYKFGLGLEIGTEEDFARKMRPTGSLGWRGYYGTQYLIDPENELIILFYTNKVSWYNNDVWGDFMRAVYMSLK